MKVNYLDWKMLIRSFEPLKAKTCVISLQYKETKNQYGISLDNDAVLTPAAVFSCTTLLISIIKICLKSDQIFSPTNPLAVFPTKFFVCLHRFNKHYHTFADIKFTSTYRNFYQTLLYIYGLDINIRGESTYLLYHNKS